MRTINIPLLNSVNTAFRTVFLNSFRQQNPIASEIADVRTSTTLEEAYAVVGASPRMREWIGERVVQNFSAQITSIKNKDWEVTVEVDRNDIEDDRIGIYRPQIADMGRNAALLWDDLVADALLQGHVNLGFDGQYFFDTDHPMDPTNTGSASLSNLFTSRALTAANYAYVRTQMALWRMGPGAGRSLRVNASKLIVGPALEVTAKEIVTPQTIPDGSGAVKINVNQGTASVVVLPEISGTDWYLIDANNQERPIILAQRKKPEFVAKTDSTDDSVFWRKKYHYGVDARGVAGYGPWFLAAKATA
jgi:phage major head subunit gpT-like protein